MFSGTPPINNRQSFSQRLIRLWRKLLMVNRLLSYCFFNTSKFQKFEIQNPKIEFRNSCFEFLIDYIFISRSTPAGRSK